MMPCFARKLLRNRLILGTIGALVLQLGHGTHIEALTTCVGSHRIASVLGFAGVLLDYLARILVVSQPSKLWMAQVVDLRFILHPFMA
jgi:hypothetical protein